MKKKIKLAYSPCPNDCFMFYALKHNIVDTKNYDFEISLHDIETLNKKAKGENFDVTKLSFPALFKFKKTYEILNSGAALGKNCGPLIVAHKNTDIKNLKKTSKIATPGDLTTANLLLDLYLKKTIKKNPMPFNEIMPAIKKKKIDFGVIIHEGRFTYKKYDLKKVVDLGDWWEKETNLPIPLGLIAIKKNIDKSVKADIENIIKKSIEFSFKNRKASKEYIKQNSQELDDKVIENHINLYVNNFSINLGKDGKKAINTLENRKKYNGKNEMEK